MRFALSLFFILFLSSISFAHCPLCIGATGAAVATARLYGINDMVTGLFVGIFVVSTSLWLHITLRKRNNGKNYLPLQSSIIIFLSILATLVTFYYTGFWFGNSILGMSTIIVGTLFGTIISTLSFLTHDLLRSLNGNRNYIPFQPILINFVAAFLSVLAFYTGGVI